MDTVHRFLFEALDIRGVLVQLGPAWQAMHARRNYPEAICTLLGELAAVTTLMGSNLKAPGRLSFQLQGSGTVKMLVVDCDEQLRLRGMARESTDSGEAGNSQSTALRPRSGSAVQSRDSTSAPTGNSSYFTKSKASASATLIPSIAAEKIPPA